MKDKRFFIITIIDDFYNVFFILINTFGILFFYEYFEKNIILTFLPFVFIHFMYAILVVPFSKVVGGIGTKKLLTIASFLTIISSIPIYLFDNNESVFLIYIWATLVVLTKLFLHVPLNYLFGKYTNHSDRGTQFAFHRIKHILICIMTPALGGFISEGFGISGLFLFAILTMFLSIIPISLLHNIKYDIKVNYEKLKTYKGVNKMLFINYFRWWSITASRAWVVYIYLYFSSSFEEIGLLVALTSAVSIILAHFLGKLMTSHSREKSTKAMYMLEGASWLIRGLASRIIPIPILDTIGRFTWNLKEQASNVISFDWMTDEIPDEEKDEIIVLREFHINIIDAVTFALTAIIIYMLNFEVLFLVVAIVSFLYSIIKRK